MSTSSERQKDKEREQAREREEREERLREQGRQQEKERQEMELEMESARLREIQEEREREQRVRQWERELELEKEKEMERARETEHLRKEREKELEGDREKLREEEVRFTSHQDFYGGSGITEKNYDFQHRDKFHSLQPKPQAFSHSQTQNQASWSAFHPVSPPSKLPENRQPFHQGYARRSCTPTEVRMNPSPKQNPLQSHEKHIHEHV